MKRKFFLAMTMVLTTSFLASCSACDSCAGTTKITFKDYYLKNESINQGEVYEQLTYKVTHQDAGTYNGYEVVYENGTYVTTLTKSLNDEYFTLTSELTIDVRYTYKEETVSFTDTVVSSVEFYSADSTLRPVRSNKTLHTRTPSSGDVSKLEDCYVEYNQTVSIEYSADLSEGRSLIVDHLDEDEEISSSFTVEDMDKYTYVDNEQLLFALRCLDADTSGKVQLYSPFLERTQNVAISADSSTKTSFNLTIDGEEKSGEEITYVPFTLTIDEENSGQSQTVWVAKTTAADDNKYRNVILKYISPMPYTLGELQYELVSMTRASS